MLQYVQDMRVVRRMGCSLSDQHVVLCKVRVVGPWIKRREVEIGTCMIRNEKLKENQYREGYASSFEEKGLKFDGDNVEYMWE